jgi:hypothetical protein
LQKSPQFGGDFLFSCEVPVLDFVNESNMFAKAYSGMI